MPVAVVSPYAKPHYVSHVVDDHTSILRFIELRFGLPALTNRDVQRRSHARYVRLLDAHFPTPPVLPTAVVDPAQLAACPAPASAAPLALSAH